MTEEPNRKLAILLHADVVGSTDLVRLNETVAHERMRDVFQRFSQIIGQHGGVAHEIRGDALVAEFPGASNASTAALEFQADNQQRNQALDDEIRPLVRIGIAMGEVVVADNTVTGEGIVLAQRLEQLAEADGVCIQRAAYDTIPERFKFDYTDLGEQTLKGFNDPVRVYAVSPKSPSTEARPSVEQTRQAMDKPSLAVLPFTNMSGDPEQEFFSDGITEDIITELSRIPLIYVVSRHSSFAFKGQSLDIKEIGKQLEVDYVLEGSVRRAGNRVRITAQMIEAESGNHIWAERYDRELEDIFAVQDEVTHAIAGVMPGRVQDAVAERASRKQTDNIKAYEYVLQGKSIRDTFGAVDTLRAREFYQKAIDIDPRYSRAIMYLADTYLVDFLLGIDKPDTAATMARLTREAFALDSLDRANQEMLAFAYVVEGQWEEAEIQTNKTLSNLTTEAEQILWCGYSLLLLGYPERARDCALRAIELNPMHPYSFYWTLGMAHFFAHEFEEVTQVAIGEALLNSTMHGCLAGAYAFLGRDAEARNALDAFIAERRIELDSRGIAHEGDTVSALAAGYRQAWRRDSYWELFAEGLRKAGLPD